MTLRDYQQNDVNAIFEEWKEHKSTLYVAATGLGKCFDPSTRVLMRDGYGQEIGTIRDGDWVMSPSGPKQVYRTTSGKAMMYQVTPTKGRPYIVNEGHILSLKITNIGQRRVSCAGEKFCAFDMANITVEDWLASSKTFKHVAKGWRSAVHWKSQFATPLSIPPYMLGLWIGDGTASAFVISKPDPEIRQAVSEFAGEMGMRMSVYHSPGHCPSYAVVKHPGCGKLNPITEHLRALGLCNEKHIPTNYLLASEDSRRQLLAGLLDSDGSLADGCYDYISKSRRLAEQVASLSRSLGLAAYLQPCTKGCQNGFVGLYWRVTISGETSDLPLRIHRKKAQARLQKKNVLLTGIKVEPIGVGDYCGFTLNHSSGLFMLDDYTVVHNTRVMVEVARRSLPRRTLLIAHRDELIWQAQRAFRQNFMESEIEKAGYVANASPTLLGNAPVVIASVQTLLSGKVKDDGEEWRRMHRFKPQDFGVLLYDESHHSVSPGNKRVVDYFTNGNPDLRVLGVTATPDRADEEALGQIFESVASERDILWAIRNGWLVDVDQQFASVAGLDFSHIRTTAGDLNGADLSAVMEAEQAVQGVVQPTLEALFYLEPRALSPVAVQQWGEYLACCQDRRRCICFTTSVKHAEMLCNIFNRAYPGLASWVCGKTRDEDRKQILREFGAGHTSILCNCGVTTEGYDNPAVDLIVMARPTKSRCLYSQMIGRGTRPLPGIVDGKSDYKERLAAIADSKKPSVLVLDFVGNSGHHKLITSADVLGGNVSDKASERAVLKAKKSGQPVRMSDFLVQEERLIKEEDAEERRKREEEMRIRLTAEEARKQRLIARTSHTFTKINPFDALDMAPVRERGWDRSRPLTEKQRAMLARQGIDPDSMGPGAGRALISEMFRRWGDKLCTIKQAAVLKRYGYETKDMSMSSASELLNKLAANKWKRV